MWQAWTNGILGLWLILAAFLGFGPTANLANNLIVGALVGITASTALKGKPGQSWSALVFAVWMIVAAFIPSLVDGAGYLYNDLISGLVITIAGFASFGHSHQEKLA
jgi:hypothetical protein